VGRALTTRKHASLHAETTAAPGHRSLECAAGDLDAAANSAPNMRAAGEGAPLCDTTKPYQTECLSLGRECRSRPADELLRNMSMPSPRHLRFFRRYWPSVCSRTNSCSIARTERKYSASSIPPLILIFLVLGTIFLASPRRRGGALARLGARSWRSHAQSCRFDLLKQALENTTKLSCFVLSS